MKLLNISPIGRIHSCYKEKFGIPRQPGLVRSSTAELCLNKDFTEESVRGLSDFSHIWLSFIFHKNIDQGWKPLVRPPRLGGNKKMGVFATRSPFRPNGTGLSVVELLSIDIKPSGIVLHLGGCDLLDKTPVFDIKPYLPYIDSVSDARGGFAVKSPTHKMRVSFTALARQQCEQAEKRLEKPVCLLIEEILGLDPRPSYQQGEVGDRVYAMKLYDFDLRWKYCEDNEIQVLEVLRNT